jgi:hypothetical protein
MPIAKHRSVAAVAILCLCCAVLLLCPLDVLAEQAAAQTAPSRDALLAQLASDDFTERRLAHRALLRDEALTEPDLARFYLAARTPEQRQRLLDIARHHFVRLLRLNEWPDIRPGALGVIQSAVAPEEMPEPLYKAMEQELATPHVNRPVIRLVSTLPGFPAYAHMRPGDYVVKVNGQMLPANVSTQEVSGEFGQMIIRQMQGSNMTFTVWRDGALRDVTVKLASADAIRNLYEPTDRRLKVNYRRLWWQFRDGLVARDDEAEPLGVDLEKAKEPDRGE